MKVRKEISVPDFREYAKAFRDSDHWLPEMTDEVLESVTHVVDAYIEEAQTYEDTESKIIVLLSDGRFGVFMEWSDTSGHG